MTREREPSGYIRRKPPYFDCWKPPKRGTPPRDGKPPCKWLGIGGIYYEDAGPVVGPLAKEKGINVDEIEARERLSR